MMTQAPQRFDIRFHVPFWLDILGRTVEDWPHFWTRVSDLESNFLREHLDGVRIDRPVYIAGLARSGSTILLELLARHPDVITHRYRDFPLLAVPWLWNAFVDRAASSAQIPRERAHSDGIVVTVESPEAFEEMIWTTFFPELHDPAVSNVLGGHATNPDFEAFYRDHIRKLLYMRGGHRYVTKANYNVTRLGYLLKLFPDARFVVPIRDPVWHVASLMKQHELFCRAGAEIPRVRRYMRRAGHFEFGLDFRLINTGDREGARHIQKLLNAGHEIEAWARYWAMIYDHVAEVFERSPEVAAAGTVVHYEDLCDRPRETIGGIVRHLELPDAGLTEAGPGLLRRPSYYQPPFTREEEKLIRDCTEVTAKRFGYGADGIAAPARRARTAQR